MSSARRSALAGILKRDELRLYRLIWERFVASQMSAAVYDQTSVEIEARREGDAALRPARDRKRAEVRRLHGAVRRGPRRRSAEAEPLAAPKGAQGTSAAAAARARRRARAQGRRARSSTSPNPRRASRKRRSSARSKRTGSAVPRPTARSSRRSRRAGTSSRSSGDFRPTEIGIVGERSARRALQRDHEPRVHGDDGSRSSTPSRSAKADWVDVLRDFYGPFEHDSAEAERKLPKLELKDEPTDEIVRELRPSDGDQDGPLRALHLVLGVSRVQDDEADPQGYGRDVPQRRRARSSSASRGRGARSSAARTIRSATSSRGTGSSPSLAPCAAATSTVKSKRGDADVRMQRRQGARRLLDRRRRASGSRRKSRRDRSRRACACSAAALRGARRRGRRRSAASTSNSTRCARCGAARRTRPMLWRNSSAAIRCAAPRSRTPSDLLKEELARWAR